jgi:hypothetical protein
LLLKRSARVIVGKAAVRLAVGVLIMVKGQNGFVVACCGLLAGLDRRKDRIGLGWNGGYTRNGSDRRGDCRSADGAQDRAAGRSRFAVSL